MAWTCTCHRLSVVGSGFYFDWGLIVSHSVFLDDERTAGMQYVQRQTDLEVNYALNREVYEYASRLIPNEDWLDALAAPQDIDTMQRIVDVIQPKLKKILDTLQYTKLSDVEALFVEWGAQYLVCGEVTGWQPD